jgi:hypothetical protein
MKKTYCFILSVGLCLFLLAPSRVTAQTIASGTTHNLALCTDSTVWVWGRNNYGQLGNGSTVGSPVPVQVSGLSSIIAIGSGANHSFALRSDGTVWAWGRNVLGQLGDGSISVGGCQCKNTPVQVSGLTGIIAIAGGAGHSLALKDDGTVWAWGSNSFGQLGNGTNDDSPIPVQVAGLSNIIAIASDGDHSLALRGDSTVWAWGRNLAGQLGDGSTSHSSLPVQAIGLTGIIAIAGGSNHSLAIDKDGSLWGWGNNADGQLLNGSTIQSHVPVQSALFQGITAIAGGSNFSLVLKNDSTLWGAGSNNFGQLGNGTTTASSVPVQAQGLGGIISIQAGSTHSFARHKDGSLRAWGYNLYGQAGNGTESTIGCFCTLLPVQPRFVFCGQCIPLYSSVTSEDAPCYGECNGTASAQGLGGVPPYSYLWGNAQQDSSLTGLCSGTHIVTISDSQGCSARDTAHIAQPPPITGTDSLAICSGDSIYLESSYQSTAGIYYDTLSSSTGCDSIIAISLGIKPVPALSFTADTTFGCHPLQVSFSNTSSGSFLSCQWTTGDGTSIPGCEGFSHSYASPGLYTVSLIVSTPDQCSHVHSIPDYIHVDICDNIIEADAGKTFNIYPNPNTGSFKVITSGHKSISIYDLYGREVYHHKGFSSPGHTELNVSGLSPGIYLLKLSGEEGNSIQKIICR